MNALIIEKFTFQVADSAAIAAQFIATRNYQRMYHEAAEVTVETIEVAIKGLVALYGWVMLQFSTPEPVQPTLTGTEPIAALPPASEEPQRVLITPPPVGAGEHVLVTPAPTMEPLELLNELLAIAPAPAATNWDLPIRQLKALASLESVKGYCNMRRERLIEKLAT